MQKKSLKSCSTAKNVQKITKIQRHAQKWYADTNEHDDNKYNTILNHGWRHEHDRNLEKQITTRVIHASQSQESVWTVALTYCINLFVSQ